MNTNCYTALAIAVMSVLLAFLAPTSEAMGICFGGGYPKCCQVGLINIAKMTSNWSMNWKVILKITGYRMIFLGETSCKLNLQSYRTAWTPAAPSAPPALASRSTSPTWTCSRDRAWEPRPSSGSTNLYHLIITLRHYWDIFRQGWDLIEPAAEVGWEFLVLVIACFHGPTIPWRTYRFEESEIPKWRKEHPALRNKRFLNYRTSRNLLQKEKRWQLMTYRPVRYAAGKKGNHAWLLLSLLTFLNKCLVKVE